MGLAVVLLAVLAMNRLRQAYPRARPGLAPYFTASPHDDRLGFEVSYSLSPLTAATPRSYLLVTAPTVLATIDAAVAVAFALVWAGLFLIHRRETDPLAAPSRGSPRRPASACALAGHP